MGVELSNESDLSRRISARYLLENGRQRFRCKRCKKAIPDDRRRDSIFCSTKCHNNYGGEQMSLLRAEIRHARRAEAAPTHCECGTQLDNRGDRPGKIARMCRRCCNRKSQKRRYDKLKERK